jgi:microcystin-dependent protein
MPLKIISSEQSAAQIRDKLQSLEVPNQLVIDKIQEGTAKIMTAAERSKLSEIESGANAIPVGTIAPFAMSSPPSGWLECDGSAISRTTYSDLWSAISDVWGAGDGSTTFNLPDFRGEFLRGWDHGRGIDSGRSFASSQSDLYKSHRHELNYIANAVDSTSPNTSSYGSGSSASGQYTRYSGGSETRPRNKAVMYCIKY